MFMLALRSFKVTPKCLKAVLAIVSLVLAFAGGSLYTYQHYNRAMLTSRRSTEAASACIYIPATTTHGPRSSEAGARNLFHLLHT